MSNSNAQLIPKIDALLAIALQRKNTITWAPQAEIETFTAMAATLRKLCMTVASDLQASNDHAAAARLLRQFLELDPDDWSIRAKLGEACLHLGENKEACDHLLRASRSNDTHAPLLFSLGVALFVSGRKNEARDAFERAYALDNESVATANNLANLLLEIGEQARARTILERAVAQAPGSSQLLWTLAQVTQQSGDFDASRQALKAFIAVNPDHGEAYRSLGLQSRFAPGDREVANMEALYQVAPYGSQNSVSLGFALYRVHDQAGDHGTAWAYLAAANRGHREKHAFDLDRELSRFETIKSFYTAERLERLSDCGQPDAAPIFVVGLPRSGTSLAEQILASHPAIHGAGELDLLHELNARGRLPGALNFVPTETEPKAALFGEIGRLYLEGVRELAGPSPFHTDKMPINFMLLGLIKLALPNARIIHCRREPVANCFSLFASYLPAPAQAYSFDLTEIGRYYLAYHDLMNHWQTLLGDRIHVLDHEKLLSDQEGETRRMLDFLGLEFHPACIDFHLSSRAVRTLSATQLRNGLDKTKGEAATHYRDWLMPLADLLRSRGITLGDALT